MFPKSYFPASYWPSAFWPGVSGSVLPTPTIKVESLVFINRSDTKRTQVNRSVNVEVER